LKPWVEQLEKRELLASALVAPLHFDFGTTTSTVAPCYIGVPAVAYTSSQGYGWQDVTGVIATDRHTGDPLTSGMARSPDATFLVDLANGTYEVTPTLGDVKWVHDDVSIYAQGQQLMSGLTTAAGQFISPTYQVEVTNGQLSLRFVDGGGVTPRFALDALDIVPVPVAHAGPTLVVSEGSPATFAGSAGGSSALTYTWNFGDGASAAGSLTPTHTYAADGTYTATLTVTDAAGFRSQANVQVTVNNVAPTPHVGGPYAGITGAPIAFAATATDPGAADTAAGFTYTWDFGDGNTGSGPTPSHSYVTAGSYKVTVTATDQDGAHSSVTTSAAVQQVSLATTGIYAVGTPDQVTPQAVLTNPYVDGISVRATWDFLEPSNGVYNWSFLDSELSAAAAAGKKVSLSITAGTRTPSWVYAAGAQPFSYTDGGSKTLTIPVPWDTTFLAKWDQFIQAVGSRYASDSTLSQVKITGINSDTAETMLPYQKADVAHWLSVGYTRTKVENAWQNIADTFALAFPSQQLAMIMVPNHFPTIDANGQQFSNPQGGDYQIVDDLMQAGINAFGSRFSVQNNGLSDTWISSQVAGLANQITTGYQTLWWVTGDSTYQMNGGKAIDVTTALQEAVTKALGAQAQFLEIYMSDITNPALQGVLAQAHSGLAQAAPTATMSGLPTSGHSPVGTAIILNSTLAVPASANTGTSFDTSLSNLDLSGFTYSWTVTKDGNTYAVGAAPEFDFTPDASGHYTVSLQVTDSTGRTSLVDSQTITIDNTAPTAAPAPDTAPTAAPAQDTAPTAPPVQDTAPTAGPVQPAPKFASPGLGRLPIRILRPWRVSRPA
jgi:PKD repeat protein